MDIQVGDTYIIHGLEHIVIATHEKYVLMLNNSQSELNGSGDIILVEAGEDKKFKVVKDKEVIALVVANLLK